MQWWLRLERVLLTVWVGGMITVGYLVAPTLFALIGDRSVAGEVAVSLFASVSWIGLVCGGVLLAGLAGTYRQRPVPTVVPVLLTGMVLVIAIGQFAVSPLMLDLRNQAGPALQQSEELYSQFRLLHGLSSGLFLINSLAGLYLIGADWQVRPGSRA